MTEIHICRGVNRRFLARAKMPGCRKYVALGKPTKSYAVAVRRLAEAFTGSYYKRGDVIMWADYYDPISLIEIKR